MDLGTGTKKQKIKPRPCLIWSAEPLQRLLMSKFDGIDVNDPDFQCGLLSADYIRRRLLAVYPKRDLIVDEQLQQRQLQIVLSSSQTHT
jgi:hypothetical protein